MILFLDVEARLEPQRDAALARRRLAGVPIGRAAEALDQQVDQHADLARHIGSRRPHDEEGVFLQRELPEQRAGVTFKYGEAGPVGLLEGKRVIVVESRGGLYSSGPTQAMDSQEPHLRTMLGFIGISDVTFVRAEKLGYGPEAREQAINDAKAELARVA